MPRTGKTGYKSQLPPTPLRGRYSDQARERIRTGSIIERMTCFVMNEKYKGHVVKMTGAHIAAAKILLAKSLPDLQTVTVETNSEKSLVDIMKAADERTGNSAGSDDAVAGESATLRH